MCDYWSMPCQKIITKTKKLGDNRDDNKKRDPRQSDKWTAINTLLHTPRRRDKFASCGEVQDGQDDANRKADDKEHSPTNEH